MNEDKVVQKLSEHDKRFDKLEDKITGIAVDVHEMKDAFVTEGEFGAFRNQSQTAQDEMVTILRRLDQERTFSSAWVARI